MNQQNEKCRYFKFEYIYRNMFKVTFLFFFAAKYFYIFIKINKEKIIDNVRKTKTELMMKIEERQGKKIVL